MKRIWANIRIFLHYLFAGMVSADKEISNGEKNSSASDGVGIEQKKEVDNVYSQMLRGEVTEEVKELRYEMYQADRKSHDYVYSGGGRATKKNDVFGFDGAVLEDDGFEVELVQENDTIAKSLTDYGIVSYGDKVFYDDTKDNDPDELHDGEKRIHIKYDYNPRFRIEKFARKVVVKKTNEEGKRVLDLYFWENPDQFERISRIFSNYINGVYSRTERPDSFEFQTLSFVSYKAFGSDDIKLYAYENPKYLGIKKFDGNFVVSFMADIVESGTDLLDEIYHQRTEEKIKNKEARKGATVNLLDAAETLKEPEVTNVEADRIFGEVSDGEK